MALGMGDPRKLGIVSETRKLHDPLVRSALTAERVRSDLAVLARGGLDVATFLTEVDESLRRAVPHAGACYALVDPSTRLLTKTYKFGDLAGRDDHDMEWAHIEYGDTEPTCFTELAALASSAAGVHESTAGDVVASRRMRDYMIPYFDYGDELRAVARSGDHVWGGLALFRGGGEAAFDPGEIDFVASLSNTLATGIRAGILARIGAVAVVDPSPGPVVVVMDATGEITHLSPGADERIEALVSGGGAAAPIAVLGALVARARAWACGLAPAPPRIRVRSTAGEWQVLHAAPLAGRDGHHGDVVITIEAARPPEIVPLVVAAFDLTSREQDVTQLVLGGADTKQIAARLHLSTYTVQDHLKAIFDKADVRSRRELVAKVFFDCHVPNKGDEIAPSGWFTPA